MVAAHEHVVDDGAEGEWIAAVRALIGEGHDASSFVAIERDRLTKDRASDRTLEEFGRKCGDVPVLTKKHAPPCVTSRRCERGTRLDVPTSRRLTPV